MKVVAIAAALTAVLLALPAQAQKSVNLQARTAGDLAELCGANPKEALGDAIFMLGSRSGMLTGNLVDLEQVVLGAPANAKRL